MSPTVAALPSTGHGGIGMFNPNAVRGNAAKRRAPSVFRQLATEHRLTLSKHDKAHYLGHL